MIKLKNIERCPYKHSLHRMQFYCRYADYRTTFSFINERWVTSILFTHFPHIDFAKQKLWEHIHEIERRLEPHHLQTRFSSQILPYISSP